MTFISQVDRLIAVAGEEQMKEFSHLFRASARKNMSDGHLWFSVVARPPASRFTRVQRVCCCLCLLYTTMLANALFYGVVAPAEGAKAVSLGPFAMSMEQVCGVICMFWLSLIFFGKSSKEKYHTIAKISKENKS